MCKYCADAYRTFLLISCGLSKGRELVGGVDEKLRIFEQNGLEWSIYFVDSWNLFSGSTPLPGKLPDAAEAMIEVWKEDHEKKVEEFRQKRRDLGLL